MRNSGQAVDNLREVTHSLHDLAHCLPRGFGRPGEAGRMW
jgi:hypothetical protein